MQQLVANLLGNVPQIPLGIGVVGHRSQNPDADGRAPQEKLFDLRIFGQFRKTRNPVHIGPDFVQNLLRVGPTGLEFQQDHSETFARHGDCFLDAFGGVNGLFDLLADALFDLFRAGAGIGHRDHDVVQLECRKRLPVHFE